MKTFSILCLAVTCCILGTATIRPEKKTAVNPLQVFRLEAAETVTFITHPEKKFHAAEAKALELQDNLKTLSEKRELLNKELAEINTENSQEQSSHFVLQEVEDLEREIILETNKLISLMDEV